MLTGPLPPADCYTVCLVSDRSCPHIRQQVKVTLALISGFPLEFTKSLCFKTDESISAAQWAGRLGPRAYPPGARTARPGPVETVTGGRWCGERGGAGAVAWDIGIGTCASRCKCKTKDFGVRSFICASYYFFLSHR